MIVNVRELLPGDVILKLSTVNHQFVMTLMVIDVGGGSATEGRLITILDNAGDVKRIWWCDTLFEILERD